MTDNTMTTTGSTARGLQARIAQHYADLFAIQDVLDHGVREHRVVNRGESDERLEFAEDRRPMTDVERATARWTISRLRAQIVDLGSELFAATSTVADADDAAKAAA